MKLKGIKPVEQHVEKAVLGVCGVAFVGALVWQLFLTKSQVKVGGSDKLLTSAFDPAKDAANKLAGDIASANPKLPEVPKLTISDTLRLGNEQPSRAGTTVALGAGPGIHVGAAAAQAVDVKLALPAVAAPTNVVAAGYRNTISPVEKLQNPALAALLPAEQPFDKASVSIEGVFDGVAFRSVLENDPDGPGPLSAIPLSLWKDPAGQPSVEIIAIEVERKTVRNPDGTTPSAEEVINVPPPPGRPATAVRALWEERARSAGDIPILLEQLRDIQIDLIRPEYYPTIYGPEWERPSTVEVAVEDTDKARDLKIAKRQLTQLDKRLNEAKDQLGVGRNAGRGARRTERTTEPQPGRGGRMSGGGGGRQQTATAPTSELNEEKKKALEENIKRLEADRVKLSQKVTTLGGVDEGPEEDFKEDLAWIDNNTLKLWTHDMTVQPGAEYQYRMRLVINNPLFGRGLQESQKDLSEKKVIEGAWSNWTAPITIDRDREFFITNATDSDPITRRPKAAAQVFVFYYGYYRSQGGSFEPGDMLTLKVNLPDELKLADMTALENALKSAQGPAPVLNPLPEAPQGNGAPPPRGQPGRDDNRGPARGAAAPNPIMTVAGAKSVMAGIDSLFLGVRGVPEAGTARYHAVVRDLAQHIVSLAPDEKSSNPAYRRLIESARAGDAALKPKEEEKAPVKPDEKGPKQPPPPPPSGGTGKGTGGGGG